MKTLPTLTVAALLAAAGFCVLLHAEYLGAQPQESQKPADDKPAPAEAAETETPDKARGEQAQQVLRSSVKRIEGYKSIEAKIRLNFNLINYGFAGEGRYLTGPDRKMLYEIEVQLPNTTGRLLEVSDGEILYTRHEIQPKAVVKTPSSKKKEPGDSKADPEKKPDLLKPEVTVTRRNVKTILDHLQRQPDPSLHQQWIVNMGLGGLPALLTSIDKSMEFTSLKSDTIRGQKVDLIEGTWTESQRSQWLQQGQTELPQLVPDRARLAFDVETGFPLRIVFLKEVPESTGMRTMVTIDFLDVKLDVPVDPKVFVYKEERDYPARELTEAIIDQIQSAGQAPQQGR